MYKTINGWTKQSMIDHIKKNFKGKSGEDARYCLYRGNNGKKCAVGLFIPDEAYSPDFENYSVSTLLARNVNTLDIKGFMPLNKEGMVRLQIRHDLSRREETLEEILTFIEKEVE